jgi:hypothetical protein
LEIIVSRASPSILSRPAAPAGSVGGEAITAWRGGMLAVSQTQSGEKEERIRGGIFSAQGTAAACRAKERNRQAKKKGRYLDNRFPFQYVFLKFIKQFF